MDMDQLERLFLQSYQKAYRAAKCILFDSATAEDAVSEALIRMFRALERGKPIENAEAYFMRITVNEAKRICKQHKELPCDNVLDYLETGCITEEPNAEDAAYNLLMAVNRLGSNLALPIKLHYYGGFSEKEVAQLLHVSYGAVKTRISRAKAKLKIALRVQDEEIRGAYHENCNG